MTVWPDADAAGLEYARQVAKLATAAGAASVAIVSPPADVKVGWDAADALAEGWTVERAAELVAAAVPAEQIASNKTTAAERDETSEHDAAPGGRRRTPQRDVLIGLTEFVELWHDAEPHRLRELHRSTIIASIGPCARAIFACGCRAGFMKRPAPRSAGRHLRTACAFSKRAP